MKPVNAKNADTPTLCHPSTDSPLLHITSANTVDMMPRLAAISNTNSIANLKMRLSATTPAILRMIPYSAEESLWNPARWFHLAAPMGTGKTTLIYQRAREAAETGAITIIVAPRVSLAKAIFNQLREDTTLGWGLFYEGSETDKPKSQKRTIGQLGAVCTFGVLPHLIKKLKDEKRPIRIFIDEVDFGFSLLLANIFKGMATEVKETLCHIIEEHGIVTAGQTASTLAIEAITAELGIECDHITGYYMPPRPVKQNAALYMVDIATADNTKNRLVQAVIDDVQKVLAQGKNAYVFCDERITAEIVHSFFGSQSLLYDAYHRGDPENEELLRLQHLPEGRACPYHVQRRRCRCIHPR